VDAVVGDEGGDRGQRADRRDRAGVESDLLVGLAQRRRQQVGVARVAAPAGEGDLARVPAEVGPPLGEDQPRLLGPAVERQQDRRIGPAARLDRQRLLGRQQAGGEAVGARPGAQTITWTVPPSTDQAAPAT
jgi:hypothetical protein